MKQTRRTFTLIEMIVVMVIIGLILGLIGPNIINQLNQTKVDNTYNQMKLVGDSLNLYNLKMGKYPASLDFLTKEKITLKIPKDSWKNDFVYTVGGTNGYDLTSYGADGQPGGDEFNKDLSIWDEKK